MNCQIYKAIKAVIFSTKNLSYQQRNGKFVLIFEKRSEMKDCVPYG